MATLMLGEIDGYNVKDYDGKLVCDCMGSVHQGVVYEPCKHVFAAMKKGLDAQHELEGDVLVPMYDEPVDGKYLVVEATVRHSERRGSMLPFYVKGERVGWLDEGEGRWSMRLVIFEWLRSQYIEVGVCQSKTHAHYFFSPKERIQLNLDSSQKSIIAGIAAMKMWDQCWKCVNQNNDDLIPQL